VSKDYFIALADSVLHLHDVIDVVADAQGNPAYATLVVTHSSRAGGVIVTDISSLEKFDVAGVTFRRSAAPLVSADPEKPFLYQGHPRSLNEMISMPWQSVKWFVIKEAGQEPKNKDDAQRILAEHLEMKRKAA
jgi:hypothetical protein